MPWVILLSSDINDNFPPSTLFVADTLDAAKAWCDLWTDDSRGDNPCVWASGSEWKNEEIIDIWTRPLDSGRIGGQMILSEIVWQPNELEEWVAQHNRKAEKGAEGI